MKILLIGQCALQWGRLEFGNMGNYYVIEPLVREIHRVFPDATIKTVFQMTENFCKKECVDVLPLDLYYSFRDNELVIAKEELDIAKRIASGIFVDSIPPFIKAVLESDFVIDFSGDMWSDNADVAGKDRFEVGAIRDLIVQILKKPIFLIAGSPGPFEMPEEKLELARKVFSQFDLVTNREPISLEVLREYNFDVRKVKECACPSFLFEIEKDVSILKDIKSLFPDEERPIIGFALCGWNFKEAPFSKWPRSNEEYTLFVKLIEELCDKTDANICLISHSNGFPIPPAKFQLLHGRDYYVVEQLNKIMESSKYRNRVKLLEEVYDVWNTKNIISNFDMLISGRVHGAIAGLSQAIPTMIIDYGHEPKAHKLKGFARLLQIEEYVANPNDAEDMLEKALRCWNNRGMVSEHLDNKVLEVQELARKNLELVKEVLKEKELVE